MYFIVNKENFVIAASEKFLQNIGARDICLISSMYKDGSISIDNDSKSIKVLSQNLDYTYDSSKLYSAFGELTHYRLYSFDKKEKELDNKSDDISHLKQVKESARSIDDNEYKAPSIEKELSSNSDLKDLMDSVEAKEKEDSLEVKNEVDKTIKDSTKSTVESIKISEEEIIEVQGLQQLDTKDYDNVDIDSDNKETRKNNIPPVPLNRLKKKRKILDIETLESNNDIDDNLSHSEDVVKKDKFVTISQETEHAEASKADTKGKKRQSIFPWKKDKKVETTDIQQDEASIETSLHAELENIDIAEYKNITVKESNDKANDLSIELQNKKEELSSDIKNENTPISANLYKESKETDNAEKRNFINTEANQDETKKSIREDETIEKFQNSTIERRDVVNSLSDVDDRHTQVDNESKVKTNIEKNTTVAIKIKTDDAIEEDNATQNVATIKEIRNENIISTHNSDNSSKDDNNITIDLDSNAKKLNLDTDSYKMLLSSYIDETLKVENKLHDKDSKTIDMLTDAAQLLALDPLLIKLNDLKNSKSEEVENCAKNIKNYILSLQNILNSENVDISAEKEKKSFVKTEQDIKSDTIEPEKQTESVRNDNVINVNEKISNPESNSENSNIETTSDIDLVKSVPAENITLDIDATSQELNLPAILISEFIKDFLEQAKEHLPVLIDAQEKENIDKLQSTAHMLKGAANNLRLSSIGETLLNIQKSNDFANSKELIYKFASLIKGLEIALKDVESI